MYGAELQFRSAPHAEIKSEADDRAFSEPNKASKTDVIKFVCALDSGGLIRVRGRPTQRPPSVASSLPLTLHVRSSASRTLDEPPPSAADNGRFSPWRVPTGPFVFLGLRLPTGLAWVAPGAKPGEHEDRTISEVTGLAPGASQAGELAAAVPLLNLFRRLLRDAACLPQSPAGEGRGEANLPYPVA